MPRLVLHIGTGKTGTSFLQQALQDRADELAGQNWIVPSSGANESHAEFALALLDDPNDIAVPSAPQLATLASREQQLARISQRLTEQVEDDATWVLSSEYFQAALITPDLVEGCASYFRRWFSQIDVVVYLRRQDYTIPSLYTEAMKTLVPDRKNWELDWEFINSRWIDLFLTGIVKRWMDAFGADNVIARPYFESWRRDPAELLEDFCDATQVPRLSSSVDSLQVRNEALSAQGVAFIRLVYPELNRRVLRVASPSVRQVGTDEIGRALQPFLSADASGSFRFRNSQFVNAVAEATKGEPLRLTPPLAAKIAERYRVVNTELVELVGNTDEWAAWQEQQVPQLDASGTNGISDECASQVLRELGRTRVQKTGIIRRLQRRLK